MVSWSWKMKENLFGSYEYAKISIIFTNFVSFERFLFYEKC